MRNIPFLASVVFLLASACANSDTTYVPAKGSPSGTVPAARDAASFCTALCDRTQACDESLDHQTCANSCTNSYAAVFPKLRADVVDLVVGCFDGKDCKTVLGGNVVSTCVADAIASVAPTDAASDYCDSKVLAKKKCSATIAKADCLEEAKLFADGAIAQAQNCTARPCGEIDACVSAAFGAFGKITTPSTSGASCTGFTELGSCRTCAEGACCEQAAACGVDPQCRSLMQVCSNGLGDTGNCYAVYNGSSTSSQSLLRSYFTCAQSSCSSACGQLSSLP